MTTNSQPSQQTVNKKRPPHVPQHTERPNPLTFDTPERRGESEKFKMKKLNMSGAPDSLPENSDKVKDFETLKRDFETALADNRKTGRDYCRELLNLSTAIAFSVVNKCVDPQRKTALGMENVSNSGLNPAMLDLRRGIASDRRTLEDTAVAAETATHATLNKDGDPVTEVADKNAEAALKDLMGRTLSDGIDLVHTAAVALLEMAADHANEIGWLDAPYIVNRLSRKVYINLEDSAAYRDEETTPIQEVYREVRRAIQKSRAVQTDPHNGYTYIEDLTLDGLDTIYYRLHKWSDLGGYAHNDRHGDTLSGAPAGFEQSGPHYTADAQTVKDYYAIIERLDLTPRQREVLELRQKGMGYRAIATYFGVSDNAIVKTVKQIQKKADAIGLTPDGVN